MTLFQKLTAFLITLCTAATLSAQGPSVEVTLPSRAIVVGEKTILNVEVQNIQISDWPDSPRSNDLAITRQGKTHLIQNNVVKVAYQYIISAFKPGLHTIPPFQIRTSQGIVQSQPIPIKVYPIKDLAVGGLTIKPNNVPYLSGTFLPKNAIYVGETMDIEAKLYVPKTAPYYLGLAAGQVIEMEKENIAAWRLTCEKSPTGYLDHDGYRFLIYTYRSSLNALAPGELSLGPGTAEPVFSIRTSQRSIFGSDNRKFPVTFPARTFTAKPLPEGAPPEFDGAVGNFTLNVPATTHEIKFGEALTLEPSISGKGNLTQFKGPTLIDPLDEWKQFEMTTKPTGSERRTNTGTIEYSQVIRPIKKAQSIPAYRFSYFDPLLEKYHTLETASQPISIIGDPPAEATSENTPINLNQPTFLTPTGTALKIFPTPHATSKTKWLWHLIPATLLLLLLAKITQSQLFARKLRTQPQREFQSELTKVKEHTKTRSAFYQAAARFATTWHGENQCSEIFETRDEICYHPDPETQNEPLPTDEKNRILNLLKTLTPILLATLLLFQTGTSSATNLTPAELEAKKVETLAELETNPSKEHYHNLSICEQQLGNPGAAALWAYRYQAQGEDATALLKNLPGKKAEKRKGLAWLTFFSKNTYLQLSYAAAWATLLFILTLKLTHSHLRSILLKITLPLAITLALLAPTAWYFYPTEISYQPLHKLAVVTHDTPLKSQPYQGSKTTRENLTASLCQITAQRADWSKITLPGGQTGWIPQNHAKNIATNPK